MSLVRELGRKPRPLRPNVPHRLETQASPWNLGDLNREQALDRKSLKIRAGNKR